MQNDDDFFPSQQSGMDTSFDMSFATPSNMDMFSFSTMAAPATAPAYINTQSFWDPSSCMVDLGMPMPFLDAADPFSVPNEWQQGQGQQMGMTQVSQPLQQTQQATQVQTKHRPIMAKPPTLAPIPASANRNMQAFGQNQSVGAPPASIQTLGSPFQFGHDFAKPSRSSHKHTAIVPSTIAIPSNPFPPPTRIPSPQKNYRPSVRRAASDVQKRPSKAKPAAPEVQPPPNFAGKGRYSAGTAKKPAPSKETMASIPETAKFSPRTSVTFSIDEFGRAKTETTVIIGEETSSRPRSSQRPGTAGFEDEEESTDEEMVVISSRRNSFTTSTSRDSRPREKPKTARFETTYCSRSRPRETGDATRALKRVVENRRKSISGLTAMPPSDQGATIRIQSSRDRERERERLYRRRSYGAGSAPSSNFSASPNYGMEDDDTDIDTDMVDTPATERSEATRCVCSRKERAGDEFMVLCGSCEHLLHGTCVNIRPNQRQSLYICAFCAQTPHVRLSNSRGRDTVILDSDPLGRFDGAMR